MGYIIYWRLIMNKRLFLYTLLVFSFFSCRMIHYFGEIDSEEDNQKSFLSIEYQGNYYTSNSVIPQVGFDAMGEASFSITIINNGDETVVLEKDLVFRDKFGGFYQLINQGDGSINPVMFPYNLSGHSKVELFYMFNDVDADIVWPAARLEITTSESNSPFVIFLRNSDNKKYLDESFYINYDGVKYRGWNDRINLGVFDTTNDIIENMSIGVDSEFDSITGDSFKLLSLSIEDMNANFIISSAPPMPVNNFFEESFDLISSGHKYNGLYFFKIKVEYSLSSWEVDEFRLLEFNGYYELINCINPPVRLHYRRSIDSAESYITKGSSLVIPPVKPGVSSVIDFRLENRLNQNIEVVDIRFDMPFPNNSNAFTNDAFSGNEIIPNLDSYSWSSYYQPNHFGHFGIVLFIELDTASITPYDDFGWYAIILMGVTSQNGIQNFDVLCKESSGNNWIVYNGAEVYFSDTVPGSLSNHTKNFVLVNNNDFPVNVKIFGDPIGNNLTSNLPVNPYRLESNSEPFELEITWEFDGAHPELTVPVYVYNDAETIAGVMYLKNFHN